jgi:hypothetical protein
MISHFQSIAFNHHHQQQQHHHHPKMHLFYIAFHHLVHILSRTNITIDLIRKIASSSKYDIYQRLALGAKSPLLKRMVLWTVAFRRDT